MPVPDRKALKTWAQQYVETWNAGDQEAWVANWRKVLTGDIRMLDPVGTPEKHGFQHCCLDSWDLFQSRVRFRHVPGSVFVNGNEVAWTLENHLTVDGEERKALSIETYRFEDDGSVVVRTYYHVPQRNNTELGEMFQTYLPE